MHKQRIVSADSKGRVVVETVLANAVGDNDRDALFFTDEPKGRTRSGIGLSALAGGYEHFRRRGRWRIVVEFEPLDSLCAEAGQQPDGGYWLDRDCWKDWRSASCESPSWPFCKPDGRLPRCRTPEAFSGRFWDLGGVPGLRMSPLRARRFLVRSRLARKWAKIGRSGGFRRFRQNPGSGGGRTDESAW